MKIQIIGFSGSGKSTLAKKLGEIYNIPVLYLDNTKFYGNWEEYTAEQQTAIVKEFMDKNSHSWVIDGNYRKIYPERFQQSDMTIYMNFNRFKCFVSAYKRYKKYKGSSRESCPCDEKFDWEFAKWILFKSRTRQKKKQLLELLNKTNGKKYIFKNRKQVNKFVELIKNENKTSNLK